MENSAFEAIAGNAVMDNLEFVLITGTPDEFKTPLRVACSNTRERLGQKRLSLAPTNGSDAKDDRLPVSEIRRGSIGGKERMITLKDFGFVIRELLDQPILIVTRNGNLEFDSSVQQRAIHPRRSLEDLFLQFRTRGIAAAIKPLNSEVIGIETWNAVVCEMVDRAAPVAVALPFVSSTEMKMGELDLFRKKRISQSARGGTGGRAGFPGEMP